MQIESFKINVGEPPTECDKCGSKSIRNVGLVLWFCNKCDSPIMAKSITFDEPEILTMKKIR